MFAKHFQSLFSVLQLLLLLPFSVSAQVQDNFSDGNLTENPAWAGDVPNFKVNTALELQLNAPDAGASALYLPAQIADSNVWEMNIRLEFDPSNSNRLRIYLMSDSTNLLTGSGYFLSIGKDGSTDAIELYRQNAGAITLLASAASGGVAVSPKPRLKVTREAAGLWTLAADYTGGLNYVQEFTVQDATFGSGGFYFGFHCAYSATRKDKFFFDNILVSPLLPDTEPPSLVSATAISATEVDAVFSEPLDEMTATEPSNFLINNGIGEPAAAFLDAVNKNTVHLSLANPLTSLANYTLTATGVADLADNPGPAQTASFTYIKVETAVEFDILINEIMADPSPPVTLPNVEFIELYNRSNKVINLKNFGFSSGGTPQLFPDYQMLPGSYVIVCDDSNFDSLKNYGPVIVLASFPALSNDADELTLTAPGGSIIHFVSYTLATYRNSQKDDGGWTLELVNPFVPCEGERNWTASASLLGGTPGQPNSVLKAEPDTQKPELRRVSVSRNLPSEVQLFFSEGLDKASAENAARYTVSNGIAVVSASLVPPEKNNVRLQLATPLQPNILYEVTVSNEVSDCSGNTFGAAGKLPFALPDTIGPMDIVINEILFNPHSFAFDFLELYNRSDKIFNLKDLVIGNLQAGKDTVVVQVNADQLFFPGDYAVFTKSPPIIFSTYTVLNPNFLIPHELPGFADDAGNVTIYRAGSAGAIIIDAFDYHKDFHHPLLDDQNGVSLERLNPGAPTQNRSNWHSAASTAGFATPTYQNSQFFASPPAADDFFDIPEKKLSPDGDGFQDFLLINYKTDKPGYLAKVKIFDAGGRPVKSLVNNELLPAEGFFRWDGDMDEGGKASIGIYVIWIQLFNPGGTVREFKKTCVVAGRL